MNKEEHRHIGKPYPDIEARSKVTGKINFTEDLVPADALHAKILRSPYPHARVVDIDTSKAEDLSGVEAVLTREDEERMGINKYNGYWRELEDIERYPTDENIFARVARFEGDRIAAVAAVDEETAEEALKLIEVEYEKLPFVLDEMEAIKDDAPQIYDNTENNIFNHTEMEVGDVEKGFKEADYVFENKFCVPMQEHSPLEPHACMAEYDNALGELTVWDPTQGTFNVQWILSIIFDMPMNKIRVIKPSVGGAFGGKNPVVDQPVACMLSMETDRKVFLINSRTEEFLSSRRRHSDTFRLKAGVNRDGTIIARKTEGYLNAGAYADASPKVAATTGHRALVLYPVPNQKYDGYCVYTNTVPGTAMRGFGTIEETFAWESFIDDIAEELDMNPLEIRSKNVVEEGDEDPYSGQIIESCNFNQMIEKGSEEMNWDKIRGEDVKGDSKLRGVGMACGTHNTGVWPWVKEVSNATVKVEKDGSIHVNHGGADLGQGLNTVLAQICAEVFGISMDRVRVDKYNDTNYAPYDIGTHSSRSATLTGNAVKIASEKAKKQLLEVAAKMFDASGTHKLEIENGEIYIKNSPRDKISFDDVAMEALHGPDPHQIIEVGTYSPSTMAPPFETHFAEVEVDTETGEIEVMKYLAIHDSGTALNKRNVEGQIHGGIQQGLGYALAENMIYDEKSGKLANPNFTDYKMFDSSDMPKIENILTELVDSYEPTGPYGAKGLGEPCTIPVGPAIRNAIKDAIGVSFNKIPITPENVLESI